MKSYKIIFIVLLMLLVGFIYIRHKKNSKEIADTINSNNETAIGFYDKGHNVPVINPDSIIHFSVKWYNHTSSLSLKDVLKKNTGGKLLLITLEIWPEQDKNVLDMLLNGTYDPKINDLTTAIENQQQIMIRFLPEMEVPVHQLPWQYQSPEKYIDAFNYFAEKIKRKVPSTLIVWSPAGYPGDSEFWPGQKNVDLISITFGSQSEILSKAFPLSQLSDNRLLNDKIHRMRYMDKPILILSANHKINSPAMSDMLLKAEKHIDSFKNTIYVPDNFKFPVTKPQRNKLVIGAYDPRMRLGAEPALNTEHIFTDWGEIQTGSFAIKFNEVLKRQHDAIVTVEPWRDTTNRVDHQALQNTVRGKYDREISALYKVISGTNRKVYLRWAHEMEIPIHRYTWQSQSFTDYINSFRYFMNFRKKPANVFNVWGPAGDRGSIDWYPGNDVVDYISIAIYGLPDKNITDQYQQESFNAIFERKYYRMRFIDKPVFITEFGVKGTEQYKKKWLNAAAATINKNKQIFGVCYFNLYDNPKVWGSIKAPDWSISNATFRDFSKSLR